MRIHSRILGLHSHFFIVISSLSFLHCHFFIVGLYPAHQCTRIPHSLMSHIVILRLAHRSTLITTPPTHLC